jgi:transcriptional regulator with XRE-family HTH domain
MIAIRDILAANLRRLRVARRLSLSELARLTGIGKATLSGIENGRANPTVETVAALARALGASLGELLEDPAAGTVQVIRAPSTPVPRRDLDALGPGEELGVAEIALAPREVRELPPGAPGTRARLYVLQGTVIAGPVERISELGAGDYASFPADTAHVYEAGTGGARALLLSR